LSERATGFRPFRVCYYMQTHTRRAQVARLVRVIKEASPDSLVLIDHDAAGSPLDLAALDSLPGVHVIIGPGGYGDFSHLDRYFGAVDWLDAHGMEFDWLQNMTGQDYLLQSSAAIEHVLAHSDADGYLQYAPVFPDRTPRTPTGARARSSACALLSIRRCASSTDIGGLGGRRLPSNAGCAQ
jgi:hypothetical protein